MDKKNIYQSLNKKRVYNTLFLCGERGIRTLGTVTRTHV